MGRALAVVVALLVALAMAIVEGRPPPAQPASAPATEFSAERAMRALEPLAAKPHPTGSAAEDEVRATLVHDLEGLGLEVSVQDATSMTEIYAQRWDVPVLAAHVRNVVAWRSGTTPGPSLLLTAHYDSRELAPGASDDGYGTAALLETARALMASPPLRHDVVFLFTDSEEMGLLGARAFVEHHPLARDVGLVLNFEARGDRGQAFMFQTSDQAGSLIDVLADNAPHISASSLSAEVYRRMPNDTDLTVWLQAGKAGMNFANADGVERYHQPSDTIQNANPATLQHLGSYALSLARAFGDEEALPPPAAPDQVYFLAGPFFVHYAAAEAPTLAAFGTALLLVAIGVGIVRKRMSVGGVLVGALAAAVAVLAAAIAGYGVWWLLRDARDGALGMQQLCDSVRKMFLAASLALGAGVGSAVLVLARRVGHRSEVGAGVLLVWAALAMASAIALPGGSYLFTWPLILGSAAWCVRIARPKVAADSATALTAHALTAVAAVLMLLPVGLQLGVAFGTGAATALAALSALVAVTSAPLLYAAPRHYRWWTPSLLVGCAVVAFLVAWAAPPFDAIAPEPDSLVYAVEADKSEAYWLSVDETPDAWNGAVLRGATRSEMSGFLPYDGHNVLHAQAPLVALPAPTVQLSSETRDGAGRMLAFHVTAPEGTEAVSIDVPGKAECTSAKLQGRSFGPLSDGRFDVAFFGPPAAGLDLEVVCPLASAVQVRVVAQSRGFPPELAAQLPARPADRMPLVSWTGLGSSDMTLVGTWVKL